MLTRHRLLELLREQSPFLAREYGVRRMGVFGSFARGRPSRHSDVDLIVEFERPIGLRFMDLAEHLENLLGRKVDILTPVGLQAIRRPAVADRIRDSVLYV